MGMTVQELIDELMKVKDKSMEVRVGENMPDSEHVYDIKGIDYYSEYPIIMI